MKLVQSRTSTLHHCVTQLQKRVVMSGNLHFSLTCLLIWIENVWIYLTSQKHLPYPYYVDQKQNKKTIEQSVGLRLGNAQGGFDEWGELELSLEQWMCYQADGTWCRENDKGLPSEGAVGKNMKVWRSIMHPPLQHVLVYWLCGE